MAVKSRFLMFAFCVLLMSMLFIQETEARRKILRGRKTITRTYYKQAAIPAWAVVTIVGIGLMLIGGGIYVAMDKLFLGDLSANETYKNTKKSKLTEVS